MAMIKQSQPPVRKPSLGTGGAVRSTRRVRQLPALTYRDVLAVAETCVMELVRLTALTTKPPVALSAALAYESFRKQVRRELPQSPSFEVGFGDVADTSELGERFGICLEALIEAGLLRFYGSCPLYVRNEVGAIEFHGTIELTAAMIAEIDLSENAEN